MNDAYEFYDYGDFFPIVSFNSIHFTKDTKNKLYKKYIERINEKKRIALEKHMKEMGSRADEATRKGLTDNLLRLQEYINVNQNTDALLSYIKYSEAKPIKLRGDMYENTERASALLMNNNEGTLTRPYPDDGSEQIDVQLVAGSDNLNNSVNSAFNNSDDTYSDPGSIDIVVGDSSTDNADEGNLGLAKDGDLPENSFGLNPMSASSTDNADEGNLGLAKDEDLPENSFGLNPMSTSPTENADEGNLGLAKDGDLPENSFGLNPMSASPTENADEVNLGLAKDEDLPETSFGLNPVPASSTDNADEGNLGLAKEGDLSENSFGLDSMQTSTGVDYPDIGIHEFVMNPSAFVGDDTDKYKQSDSPNNSFSGDEHLENAGDSAAVQSTENGESEFQKTITAVDNNGMDSFSNVIRGGDDIQVVDDRDNTSMSAENAHEDAIDTEKDKAAGELVSVENPDSIIDTSDMRGAFGDFSGYDLPNGDPDYYSLILDIQRQRETAKENVDSLSFEIAEKTREEAKSAEEVDSLKAAVDRKLKALYEQVAVFEKQRSELEEKRSSLDETIAENQQTAYMLSGVSSQLDEILANSTDVIENSDIKGRGMH